MLSLTYDQVFTPLSALGAACLNWQSLQKGVCCGLLRLNSGTMEQSIKYNRGHCQSQIEQEDKTTTIPPPPMTSALDTSVFWTYCTVQSPNTIRQKADLASNAHKPRLLTRGSWSNTFPGMKRIRAFLIVLCYFLLRDLGNLDSLGDSFPIHDIVAMKVPTPPFPWGLN